MFHDWSGKPDNVDDQEGAESETFMGSDAAEFVNKVKEKVQSRQKRMSNVAESGEEHSIIWWMFMAATMNAATFMGKEFLNYSKFHHEYFRSHFKANVRHHCEIGERPRWDQWSGQHSVGKGFLETSVTDWWRNSYQSSAHNSLCLLRFWVVLWKDPSTSGIQRSLDLNGAHPESANNGFPSLTWFPVCLLLDFVWLGDAYQNRQQKNFFSTWHRHRWPLGKCRMMTPLPFWRCL